ncbi:hypothetical protein AMECASPLE_022997 [Ameca splendens]|uniref:Uncharacterized protein n=1 Tax=Ameca splendens TaxID=208324 RepID=A0ABV0ZNT8_9TELE
MLSKHCSYWTAYGKIHMYTQSCTIHTHSGLSTTVLLPPTLVGSSAQSLNPVAVETLPLYTMARRLHNVFLPLQLVAHTTTEWARSTPSRPPTLRSTLMKSFQTESHRTAQNLWVSGCRPAAKTSSF